MSSGALTMTTVRSDKLGHAVEHGACGVERSPEKLHLHGARGKHHWRQHQVDQTQDQCHGPLRQ